MEKQVSESRRLNKKPAFVLAAAISTTLLWLQPAQATSLISPPTAPVVLERAEPRYPVQAASDGVQGFVELQFNVEPDGSTSNIKVIDAKPKRVFDDEAIQALARWKYQPATTDSANKNVVVTMEFNLKPLLANTPAR